MSHKLRIIKIDGLRIQIIVLLALECKVRRIILVRSGHDVSMGYSVPHP